LDLDLLNIYINSENFTIPSIIWCSILEILFFVLKFSCIIIVTIRFLWSIFNFVKCLCNHIRQNWIRNLNVLFHTWFGSIYLFSIKLSLYVSNSSTELLINLLYSFVKSFLPFYFPITKIIILFTRFLTYCIILSFDLPILLILGTIVSVIWAELSSAALIYWLRNVSLINLIVEFTLDILSYTSFLSCWNVNLI